MALLRYAILQMISVCILTKNSALTLKSTLESVSAFPEVLILDNGSTDETIEIAKSFPNVRLIEKPFIGFGPLRNQAAELANYPWILALDSDEILSPSLVEELRNLQLEPSFSYKIARHNYYNGKRIKGCGWDPEYVARLYHKEITRFSDSQVHESLIVNQSKVLQFPMLHTPYRSTSEFLAKMQHYSTLFALQNRGIKSSSFTKALFHGLFAFFRSYVIQRGIFCGKEGFLISLYNANTTFYKYMKLAEENQS